MTDPVTDGPRRGDAARRRIRVAASCAVVAGLAAAGWSLRPAPDAAAAPTSASSVPVVAPPSTPSPTPTPTPTPSEQLQTGPLPPTPDVVPDGDLPASVQIPSIRAASTLVQLGTAADGTLEVPTDYAQAGWYDEGPAPGERGPAVIAGHVDSRSGPAVFYRLRELKAGDVVTVRQRDGDIVRFTVTRVEQYAKDAFPTARVYGPAAGPVLRLITCGGSFDRSTGHYRDNLVVYANLA